MGYITGKGGCVKIGGGTTVVVGIKEWSLDYNVDMFDVTDFEDAAPSHKKTMPGLKQATGSFSGNVTDGATGVLGAITLGSEIDLHLETDGTDLYDIPSAYVTGITTNVSVTGEATVTCNFISNGTVTPTFS